MLFAVLKTECVCFSLWPRGLVKGSWKVKITCANVEKYVNLFILL